MRVHDIEDLLRDYDKVFLMTESRYIKMLEEDAGDAGKVIVLLPISPTKDMPFDFITIDEIQCEELLKLYHTYEFSDRFQVIMENSCYGGLYNYVKTGILTPKEAEEAALM